MVAFGEVGKLLGLLFERPARLVELRDRGQKPPLGVEEPLLIAVPALEPTQARGAEHKPDSRGEQEGRDHHRVAPGKEVTIDGRSKGHFRGSDWQRPHGGEPVAVLSALDAGYAALNVAGRGSFCAASERDQRQIGSVLSVVVFDY